jgi:hypothetical protein
MMVLHSPQTVLLQAGQNVHFALYGTQGKPIVGRLGHIDPAASGDLQVAAGNLGMKEL